MCAAEEMVKTGCLVIGSENGLIRTSPLGSCVAVVAYDKTSKIGGIAHILLPGKSPKGNLEGENRYAENALLNLLFEINKLGAENANIEICLVGGANVLRKENDTIAEDLVDSVLEIVKRKRFDVKRASLGGYERRTAKLNLSSGVVSFTIGDSVEKKLCQFTEKQGNEQ